MECLTCDRLIEQDLTGEPYLIFKDKEICYSCYINLIEEIYKMSGAGDGGLIHLLFKECLISGRNKKKRVPIRNYKKILKELLYKYKFKCVICDEKEESKLTIDHIHPVSKGGSDDKSNLQIMCKSCNSKKSNKIYVS